ncbi:MAG: hypothetical protein IPN29_21725 [Saprospiraceae bacterium]|nr:hypothetical protein [Saprospiraceae bacterium]
MTPEDSILRSLKTIKSYYWLVFLIMLGRCIALAQTDSFSFTSDTFSVISAVSNKGSAQTANSLYFNAITPATIFKSTNRYQILSDLSDDLRTDLINWKVQTILEANDRTQLSFKENLQFLQNYDIPFTNEQRPVSENELKFAIWRTRLSNIQEDKELHAAVQYGMEYLMYNGKTEWKDLMPFVTMLMQEHYDYHYDHKRVKVKGATAGGILTTTDIFRTFRPYDSTAVAGVCRDIHDVGLRLIREMGNEFFDSRYPDKNINMDDYLFLASWTTQSSQHVTVVMTDPLDNRKSYELDWGRLIEKYDNAGYDHGRNYGNVYRIWQFDPASDVIRPIDSKKTSVGKLMDIGVYSRFEYDAFEGLRNIEPTMQLGFNRRLSSRLSLSAAAGALNNNQRFMQLTLLRRGKEKEWGKVLRYTGNWAFQTMAMEESEKKNIMYPNYTFTTAMVYHAFPRYIGHLSSSDIRLSKAITANLFLAGSFELFLNFNQFNTTTNDYPQFTNSGDASIFLTQGFQVRYKNIHSNFHVEAKILNRSFLIPKDVRLMSIKPSELLSSLVWMHSAQDLFIQTGFTIGDRSSFSARSVLEYTSLHNLLTNQEVELHYKIHKKYYLGASSGFVRNLKGQPQFWYSLNKSWIDLSYNNTLRNYSVTASGQYFNDMEFVGGLSLAFAW